MQENKKDNSWWFFAVVLISFSIIAYFLLREGNHIHKTLGAVKTSTTGNFDLFKTLTLHNILEPSAIILLQIIAILVVSRIFSSLFKRIGQPTVIGEILAGIVLGPSLLGHFFPEAYHFLFSKDSLDNLYIVSQIGLVLFMFTVGMDLNMSDMKERLKNSFIISQSSIIIPFLMGMALALVIYKEFAPPTAPFISFSLFIGISMSITAFPVLARIVQEKGLSKTHLGTVSIGSAAINDVTAWILLVAVIAIAQTGSFVSSIFTLLLTVIYILLMIFAIRPFVKRVGNIYQHEEVMNKSIFGFFILVLIVSAFITQSLGIHALFGAFMAGLIMPPLPKFRKLMVDKIEDLSVSLLLPLFFVYTGLKTEIGLLNTPELWMLCGIIILVAIAGKLGGSAVAARVTGESWRDSLSVGVLMNTRGLMELIVLNIGLEMGVLPPVIFVMLVIMALVTTFMTTPALTLIEKLFVRKETEDELIRQQAQGVFKVMIALGNPASGFNLLKIAKTVLDGVKNSLAVNVLHITAGTDTHPIYGEQYATESFINVQEASETLSIPITTEYKVADNVEAEIVKKVNEEMYDFLLVGGGVHLSPEHLQQGNSWYENVKWLNTIVNKLTKDKSIFYPGTLLHDKTKYFIENSNCSVGVFLNRDFNGCSSILIALKESADDFLLRYARRIMRNNADVTVHIVDSEKMNGRIEAISNGINILTEQFGSRVRVHKISRLNAANPEKYSLMMISYQAWENIAQSEIHVFKNIPSTLIINKKSSRFESGNMKLIQTPLKKMENMEFQQDF